MGPVSIGVEVQRNTDGDTPSTFTGTFNWIAMESIVGGHLRQMKDNLYSYISWSCHSSK